ncbi:NmrA-like family protein [Tricladium varicosporioides]|nr:NmrA-like family protein [Hymenoscyphus varicosporioides]
MVNVAIAGGTGGVGRTIVELMQGHQTHKVFILSRKAISQDDQFGATCVQVDYDDIGALKRTLEEYQIHTVLSTFGISGDSLSKSQLNLIRASAASQATKRFVPSSFAIPYPRAGVELLPPLKHYFDSIDILKGSGLEWTVFYNGIFLDYFAMPYIKTYLKPNTLVIDIANKTAGIPGTGNELVTLTYTFDLARFIVAALDRPQWPEELRVVGDQITMNEFVRLAEEVRGAKFEVNYDSIEKLKGFHVTELPGHLALYNNFPKDRLQWFLSIFELWIAEGISDIPFEGSLNEMFPDIRPLTVRRMLDEFWKGA